VAHEATRQELRNTKKKLADLTARAATADAAQLAAAEKSGAARAEVLLLIRSVCALLPAEFMSCTTTLLLHLQAMAVFANLLWSHL